MYKNQRRIIYEKALVGISLLKEGFTETEIRKIMGENQAAFYKKMLP